MAAILIVGCEHETADWVDALREVGHLVEHCADVLSFQDRFCGTPVDVLVIDIANADHGEAMLMVQARAVWRDCRVIAIARDRSYRSSALYSMGLWSPDRLLMTPVNIDLLLESVEQLRAQARVDRMIRERREQEGARPDPAAVVLNCDRSLPALWAVKPF